MTEIEIAYDYDEDYAEECASRDGNGFVDEQGRYRRSLMVGPEAYSAMRNFAENDPDATIVRVDL